MEDHWLYVLNRALVHDGPRRTLLRRAIALAFGSIVASGSAATVAKKRKHKKAKRKHKKHKPKDQPKPTPSCSGGACVAVPEWAGDQDEIEYCEFICQQCNAGDPRVFCIAEGRNGDPEATCCGVGEYCCDRGGGRKSVCLSAALACCPDDPDLQFCCDPFAGPPCSDGQICCVTDDGLPACCNPE